MQVEMFATDWIIALFCSTIPLNKLAYFFDKFFAEGWTFFYKIVISFLREIEEQLLQEEEMCDILNMLKTNSRQFKKEEQTQGPLMKLLKDVFKESTMWEKILRKANHINLEQPVQK